MRAAGVTLILAILVTSLLLTIAQTSPDCRADLSQEQIEAGITQFDYTAHYTDEHADAAFKRVEDCLRDCTRKQRSLVIKEVLLRLQFRELGQDCTSSDENYKYVLYNGDYRTDDSTAYQVWQNELLDTGLIFCTPFKHLYCSHISKKCECRPGTMLSPFGTCTTDVGGFCWIPGVVSPEIKNFPRLFDAYNNRNFHRDYSVIRGTGCDADYGFNQGKCSTDLKLFMHNICVDKKFRDMDRNLESQFRVLPRLNFGDSCNFDHQTQLFTTTEEEVKNYTIRVKKLEAIIEAKSQFCDHNRLLICGSEGKCECVKPTVYNNETKSCTFQRPSDSCQESSFKEMTATLPGRVSQEIMSGVEVARKRDCRLGCDYVRDSDGVLVEPPTTFCPNCPYIRVGASGKRLLFLLIGKNCDKLLTEFLEGAPPPSLPIDIPEYESQLELFVQFNEKAMEFRELFQLDTNSPCDYEAELDAHRLIRRIRNLEVLGMVFSTKDYKDLMSSMDKHIGKTNFCIRRLRGVSQLEPPNRPILLCGPTPVNPVCYDSTNTIYLEVWMKRLTGKSFHVVFNNQSCSPHPRDIIKYAEEQFPISSPRNGDPVPTGLSIAAYEYLFSTLESHWIQKAQYCNRTGGFECTKSVDDKTNATGKCEFYEPLLEEIQAEVEVERLAKLGNVTSKASHHSIQHFLPTLFFIHLISILNN